MTKKAFLTTLTIILGLFLFVSESKAATADHLVISQVQTTGGPGKTANDFVELYNPTEQDIDLRGMRLVKRTKTGAADTLLKSWTDSAVLKAHGFYLWANSSYADIPLVADVTTSGTIADDNGVALRSGPNDTGVVVDAVAWGEAVNIFLEGAVFAVNPAAAQVLERKPGSGQGNGEDTGNNAADFFLQTAPHPRNSQSSVEPAVFSLPLPDPSPEEEEQSEQEEGGIEGNAPPPQSPPAFHLELSEFMPNPKGKDAGQEWVEIYNPGKEPFSLNKWILDDDGTPGVVSQSAWNMSDSAIVPAGGYLQLMIPAGTFSLNNSGAEAIRLFDDLGRPRLLEAYQGPAKEGQSYAKDSAGQWGWTASPTPGNANVASRPVVYSRSLRISEILPNPAGDDLEGEFIEIYNFGGESVDLADWSIADSRKRYRISEDDFFDTEIPAQGYFVIYREISGISLNNSGPEAALLITPAGDTVDRVDFDASGEDEGNSYSWVSGKIYRFSSLATPGRVNEFSSEESPPAAPKQKASQKIAPAQPESVALRDVRSLPLNSFILTSGTVSVPPGVLGDDVAYLAGSGIRLVWDNPPAKPIQLGDVVRIAGKLTSYHHELQITVSDTVETQVIETGREVLPKSVATGEVGENVEGFLVKLSGAVTESSGGTFNMDDGSGEARIYIRESTGIEKPRMKKGDIVEVVGVVSQYNDDYRVMPRFQSDLVFGAVAVGDNADARVLGASAKKSLPRTGVNFWLMLAIIFEIVIIIAWSKFLITRKDTKNE